MEAEFRPRQEKVTSNDMFSRHMNVIIVTKRESCGINTHDARYIKTNGNKTSDKSRVIVKWV